MKEIVLVTGANKGIGLEVSKTLAQNGMKVLMGARSSQRGEEAASQLKSQGLDVEFIHLDVTDEADRAEAVRKIGDRYGKLDALVNNAAVLHEEKGLGSSKVLEVSQAVLKDTFETNFFALVDLTQKMIPLLRKSSNPRIVNVSSILGSLKKALDRESGGPSDTPFAYNASKVAVNCFTIHLAGALKPEGIRVNSVHPGWVQTDMGGEQAPLSIREGAKTIVDLVLNDTSSHSRFLHLGEELPW